MGISISQQFDKKSLVRFTLPSVLMMMFISIYSMFGSIFASNYIGIDALSAINIVFPLISTVLAIAIMFATGSNAIIAKNLGEGNLEEARENFTVIVITGVITGVILMVLTLIFSEQIVETLGAAGIIKEYAITYLRMYSIAFGFIFLNVFAQYFFITAGKPMNAMIGTFTGGILNMIVSYGLMAVFKVGIVGAAIGGFISYALPGILFVLYFITKKDSNLYFVKPRSHKGFLVNTCFNGSSEMVTNLAIAIVTGILNIIMLKLEGNDGLAAVGVIVQVQFLLNSMYIGFGAGVAPVFAYAQGEDNKKQTKNVFSLSTQFVKISSLALVILCMLFPDVIASLFISPDEPAFHLAKQGFILFSLGYLFAGYNIFSSVFFTSVSNGKISALISFLRTFVFIIGMLLILPKLFGTVGVWMAIPVAEALAIIVSIVLLKKYKNVYHF